jgi:hypothetical protein
MTLVTAVPLLALAALAATCLWVRRDAQANQDAGTPVVFQAGAFRIDTPRVWAVSCLLLFVVFIPLYLAARNTTFDRR